MSERLTVECPCGNKYDAGVLQKCSDCGASSRRANLVEIPQQSAPPPSRANVLVTTTESIPGYVIERLIGPVVAAKSHTRWKNFDKNRVVDATSQYGRLINAWHGAVEDLKREASRLGANAVMGVTMSANTSEGGSANFGGSSDAVILMGTAVFMTPVLDTTVTCPVCHSGFHPEARKCGSCQEWLPDSACD